MTLLLHDARLIDPEAGTETRGAVKISEGKIAAILTEPNEIKTEMFRARNILQCSEGLSPTLSASLPARASGSGLA